MIPLRDDNPTRITPYLTWLLVIANVAVFLMESFGGGLIQTNMGLRGHLAGWTMIPYEIMTGNDTGVNGPSLHPLWYTIFTSMFLHGSWLHLAGNMLYLIIFGNNIEDSLGRVKYILFYILCGVAAAVAQIAWNPGSMIPTLGASGAIAGVLGGYFVLFPKAKVNTLITFVFIWFTVRIPAYILLLFWLASQFFSQFTHALMTRPGEEKGGVAYLAHIGGFIAGMILIKVLGGKPSKPEAPHVSYFVYPETGWRRGEQQR